MATIPFMDYCRIERVDIDGGRARFRVEATHPLTNSRGGAHGGLIVTLLDITMGHAVVAATDGAISFATLDLNVGFLRPGQGRLVATGSVLRTGRTVAFTEGEVRNEDDELIARASGLFRPIFGEQA